MRPLTLLQKQRITLSLFFTVAVGAVFTVAAPAFVPWKVVDVKRAQALDQQRRQGKDFHIIEDQRQQLASAVHQGNRNSDDGSSGSSDTPCPTAKARISSSQGPLFSLLTDRPGTAATTTTTTAAAAVAVDPSSETSTQDPHIPDKRKRRRRKRKMINEGWQELTGRTAREEQEKQQHDTDGPPTIGENGGVEIVWKNKITPHHVRNQK